MHFRFILPLLSIVLSVPLARAQDPAANPTRLAQEAQDAFQDQDFETTIEKARQLTEVAPENESGWFWLGLGLHSAGRHQEAIAAHEKAATFPRVGAVAAYNAGCAHALVGDQDKAFDWLNKSVETGFRDAAQFASDSDLASLRDDPRYQELMQKIRGGGDARRAADVRVFNSNDERRASRLFYWGGQSSPAQVIVDYGPVAWKDEYGKMLASGEFDDRRWRLGRNFWTRLDTNRTLRFGDVEVPAGSWYLVAEKQGDQGYVLHVLDPATIRKQRLDAFQSEQTKGGTAVTLEHEEVDENATEMELTLSADSGDPSRALLEIRFGPHRLTAPFQVDLSG